MPILLLSKLSPEKHEVTYLRSRVTWKVTGLVFKHLRTL